MLHMDVSPDAPPAPPCGAGGVRESTVRIALAAIEYEILDRNRLVAEKIGALGVTCVHCAIECADCCTFCGIPLCQTDRELHVSSRCTVYSELPAAVRLSGRFHLRGLAIILRGMLPDTHPVARPICASGNLLVDQGQAAFVLGAVETILEDEIPALGGGAGAAASGAERHLDRTLAVRILHEAASGLAMFGALMDAESQRGARLVAPGDETLSASTCCPRALARTVPPMSTATWRQISLSYNLPENEHRALCASGARCIGAQIRTRDKRPYGKPLRAMRSPSGELLSGEADTDSGLCLLCMSAEIVGNLRARLLWQDSDNMFIRQFLVKRGSFFVANPVVSDLVVNSYPIGDQRVDYVDETCMYLPNAQLF
jgi:hypothetical protein